MTLFAPNFTDDMTSRYISAHSDAHHVLPTDFDAAREFIAGLKLDLLFYTDIGMDLLLFPGVRAPGAGAMRDLGASCHDRHCQYGLLYFARGLRGGRRAGALQRAPDLLARAGQFHFHFPFAGARAGEIPR